MAAFDKCSTVKVRERSKADAVSASISTYIVSKGRLLRSLGEIVMTGTKRARTASILRISDVDPWQHRETWQDR